MVVVVVELAPELDIAQQPGEMCTHIEGQEAVVLCTALVALPAPPMLTSQEKQPAVSIPAVEEGPA